MFSVLFFKQKIHDRVTIDQMNINAGSRSFVLKMHSLTYNQLTAERFSSLIKYVRYSSGHIARDLGHSENVCTTFAFLLTMMCVLRQRAVTSLSFVVVAVIVFSTSTSFFVDDYKY